MDNDNLTPPERSGSPNWDKRYTPNRNDSVSKSPRTPPLRPSSNISIYSDTSRRTPPLSQKYTSSPHTPPIVPRKSTSVAVAVYQNSPIDVDANSSGSHSHSNWQNSINNQITGSNRRNVSSYSPSSHSSKRRRSDKGYERSSDYHYTSKRSGDTQTQRHSREPITETYDLTTSSSRLSSSGRKRRAAHSPSPIRSSKRHSRSHSPRAFRSAASPVYYMSRSNRNKSG